MNSILPHTGLPPKLSENARLFANRSSYQNDASDAPISLGRDVRPRSDLSTLLLPPRRNVSQSLKLHWLFSVLHSSQKENVLLHI
ncbi:hypothetical protein CEXT_223221 [Caerostris extrusa]|uniref:Uncharacterized protein n=1 Tax=Caerostris extrusa TaxID=172846 RepID=A0AAV4TIN9_CAEEX|nr:hypothetical protein CEXT_223221 [Caerostris extrusa]